MTASALPWVPQAARNDELAAKKKAKLAELKKARSETRHALKMNAQKYERESPASTAGIFEGVGICLK